MLVRLGTSLVGGALCALALPPFGLWPLAVLGAAGLYGAFGSAGASLRAGCGFAFGVGQLAVGLWFIDQFSALGYLALLVLESAFFALLGLALGPHDRGIGAFAGALALAEWARDHVPFGGLPPGGIALGQAGGPAAALARLGGPFLIVTVVGATGAALATLGRRAGERWRWRAGLAAMVLAVGLVALSDAVPRGGPARATIEAAAVQGGGARGTSEIEVPSTMAFLATLTEADAIVRPVSLVAWPEDSLPLGQGASGREVRALVAGVAKRLHATVVAGATQPVGLRAFLNESIAFGPSGAVVATVEKAHAVPFGEYVPLRGLLSHLVNLSAVPRDAIVGRGDGTMDTPAARLAVLISYEAFFPARARSGVRGGGELVVVETNTASYASAQVPAQELAASRLDAIATGRDVLQAATVGYSALIDPDGSVRREVGLGGRGVIEQSVSLRSGSTPYDLTGDWPTLALCGALVLASGASRLRRRRARRWRAPG